MVELLLNGSPIQFKIDTGADVSVLPESTFKQLRGVTLQQASQSLVVKASTHYRSVASSQ